jgi:UMF1 family MFS transporter
MRSGFADLRQTFHELRALRMVAWFLAGYWFYIDGVGTVIKTAVDYGQSLGFDAKHLILALLVTQFVGFPSALAFGWLGGRLGAKTGILIGLGVYAGVCWWGFLMQSVAEFYGLAIVVGLVQGGVQSLSRSLYARLIPPDKAGQFFGFYNMLGKFAAVLGPLLMGTVAVLTKNSRVSILAIIGLFVVGALCLLKVQVGERMEEKQTAM